MSQARMSLHFWTVLVWTILGSLTFGFCSIWSLHFVAMLACELDLPIGIDVPLTVLSSLLAVFFTFAALASDLIWERYCRERRRRNRRRRIRRVKRSAHTPSIVNIWDRGAKPPPDSFRQGDHDYTYSDLDAEEEEEERLSLLQEGSPEVADLRSSTTEVEAGSPHVWMNHESNGDPSKKHQDIPPNVSQSEISRPSSEYSESRHSSSYTGSTHSLHGLSNIMHIAQRSTAPAKNAFIMTGETLYAGCTIRNIVKGLLWSLAVTSMHYVGILALKIPSGHFTLDPWLVVLSGLISWIVCLVGVILMSRIESHLTQQFLFAVVASGGVAAMHFTGTFNSPTTRDSRLTQ